MDKNRVEIKKVPLAELIKMLVSVYETGIDYVNLVVQNGFPRDSILITEIEKEESPVQANEEEVNFEDIV